MAYSPPQSGLLPHLPSSWVPYAELARIDKPMRFALAYYPFLHGALFAACISPWPILPSELLSATLTLLAAAIMLGNAGCTWDDIVDADLDRHVARCCLRPMARGAISVTNATTFFVIQLAVGLGILFSIGTDVLYSSVPFVALGVAYPFAKRVTYYPGVVLGLAVSSGQLVGCAALGVDPWKLVLDDTNNGTALGCLFISYFLWQVVHDSVCAHQDVLDDEKAGIGSMAVRHKEGISLILSRLGQMSVAILALTGFLIDAGLVYYVGAAAGTWGWLWFMMRKVDLKDPMSCSWWFQYGGVFVGGAIALGLLGECMSKVGGLWWLGM